MDVTIYWERKKMQRPDTYCEAVSAENLTNLPQQFPSRAINGDDHPWRRTKLNASGFLWTLVATHCRRKPRAYPRGNPCAEFAPVNVSTGIGKAIA
jgi:hypothetical protein